MHQDKLNTNQCRNRLYYCEWMYRIRALDAGWSSLAARRAHNPKVVGSNPAPATKSQVALTELVLVGKSGVINTVTESVQR